MTTPAVSKRLAAAAIALMTAAATSLAGEGAPEDVTGQFVGRWQVNRIMQQHKLPYYPFDCEAARDIREIVAIGDAGIEIRGSDETQQYQVEVQNGETWFHARRRTPVIWEAAGDTFMHGLGTFWIAYRRCP